MSDDPFEATPPRERSNNILGVRLRQSGFDWLDGQVKEHDVSRTEIVKAALAFASSKRKEFDTYVEKRKAQI